MKKIQTILILLFVITGISKVSGQTSLEIEKASKACKPVFLVAYSGNGAENDKAFILANEAKKTFKGSSEVIKINTSDPTNKSLVSKYGLAGASLPMILVMDKNSIITGGLPLKDATATKLIELIPSPKTSEIIKAMNEGKSVYLVAYKESMTNQKNIMNNCMMACNKMENKSITIKLDLDDKKESKLLQTLNCDIKAKEPVTYVINKTGQVVGTYNGITDVNTLLSAAKKAPAGGCCPGGSSSGCGKK